MAKEALTEATEAEIMLKAWLPGRGGRFSTPPKPVTVAMGFPTDSMWYFWWWLTVATFLVNCCFSNKSMLFKEYSIPSLLIRWLIPRMIPSVYNMNWGASPKHKYVGCSLYPGSSLIPLTMVHSKKVVLMLGAKAWKYIYIYVNVILEEIWLGMTFKPTHVTPRLVEISFVLAHWIPSGGMPGWSSFPSQKWNERKLREDGMVSRLEKQKTTRIQTTSASRLCQLWKTSHPPKKAAVAFRARVFFSWFPKLFVNLQICTCNYWENKCWHLWLYIPFAIP